MAAISIHASVDKGIKPTAQNFTGGTLVCKGAQNPVEVSIKAQTAHHHACGCSTCCKTKGAQFAVVAVAAKDKVNVTNNAERLAVVDMGAVRTRLKALGLEPYERLSAPLTDAIATHLAKASGLLRA